MDLVILTPLALEYTAFQQHLSNRQLLTTNSGVYETGQFIGRHHTYQIALRQTGIKNNLFALATEKAIQTFQPSLLLLGGVAGGIKDVAIGDVVVANKTYGYESGKETREGFLARPEAILFDAELMELAQSIFRNNKWQKSGRSKVYFGPIASGDKVIASTQSPVYRLIKQNYNDALALDMEAIGFAKALEMNRQVRGMVIRGISDLLDNKSQSDKKGSQEKAAANAAAFAFEWLHQLDFNQFKTTTMNDKTLLNKILRQLFPLLNLESVQNIGDEFKEATNTSIDELWEKVRPAFIEEIANVGADIKDEAVQEEVQGAIKANLRKTFRKDASLKQELVTLVEKVEQVQGENGSISISDSKNVMQGSRVSVGGNFHIGDQKK